TITRLAVVALFGFCHGLAHGRELPGSASLLTFAAGFVVATVLLHGLGLLTGRGVIVGLACLLQTSVMAQETNAPAGSQDSKPKEDEPVKLPPATVTGRADSLIGVADSATQ